jgi:CTP:molybdopterin cytidylyltransferase MocA
MGRPKMLLPVGGGAFPATLLAATVRPLLEAGLADVVVVLGCAAEEVRRRAGLPDDRRVRCIVNPGWTEGMASSLRSGLTACAGAEAVLVCLGDQPGLTADRVRRIVSAWDGAAPVVAPFADGRSGHPVLFARRVFAEMAALTGDVGAREVVRRHAGEATMVPLPHLPDIDTEDDYRAHGATGKT